MKNRKLKNVQSNMLMLRTFNERNKGLALYYLALLESGISKNKIYEFDDVMHKDIILKARQDAVDGIIDDKVSDFLKSVDIPFERIYMLAEKWSGKAIAQIFQNSEAYGLVIDALATDIAIYIQFTYISFGYAHKRLCRLIEFMENFSGDPLQEAKEKLNIEFKNTDVLPDHTRYRTKRDKYLPNNINEIRRDLEGVRIMQEKAVKKQ